jgi:hypothetical protein
MRTVRQQVLDRIDIERIRQENLREAGRFTHTAASNGISEADRLAILTEEVGEVAGEVLGFSGLAADRGDGGRLRKEVLHVASVAVAWLEYLEGGAS